MSIGSVSGQGASLASHFQQAALAMKARVETRSVGFRLGPLEVDYTSRKVTLDPDKAAGSKTRDASAQAFLADMERERLRRQVSDAAWRETADAQAGAGQAAAGQAGTWYDRAGRAAAGYDAAGRSDAGRAQRATADAGRADGAASGEETAAPRNAWRRTAPGSADETTRSDPLWRRGLAAYAMARDLLLNDSARMGATRLAVA